MKTYNLIYKNDDELITFLKSLPKKENLFQVFSGVSDKSKISHILSLINKYYPGAKVIGATTDGEIVNDKITGRKIIISASFFDKAKVEIVSLKKKCKSEDFGEKFGKRLNLKDAKVAIVFSDGLNINGDEFLKGIKKECNIPIAGGFAGDNAKFKETLVFDNKNIISKGAVAAVIKGDIFVNRRYGFNWEGIGKNMVITKAKGNIVYEIDNKKAAYVYKYYFQDASSDIAQIGIQFPLIIEKNNLKIARAVLKEYENGSLLFAGSLEEGSIVKFGFGDVSNILKQDKALFDSLKEVEVESIFIYSCMARRRFLGKDIKYEIEPFAQIADVSGFFTYGEFFTADEPLFFNQTMTILVLSESEIVNKNIEYIPKYNKLFTIKALTSLIKATSSELNDLNKNLEKKVKEKSKEILKKNEELKKLLYNDRITGLPNRFQLDEDLKIYDMKGGALVDIKGFSKINDIYGEKAGDEVLKKVAVILKSLVGAGCNVYKSGADQFLIIGYTNDSFEGIIEKIINYFDKELIEINIEGSSITLDIDVRIALVKGNYKDIRVKADLALNYARHHNLQFVEYSEDLGLEKKLRDELKSLEMVKKAIKENRIVPIFQKIEKQEVTYEALVRIKEGNTFISPFEFLDFIKPAPYYYELTKIMIKKSFEIFQNKKESVSLNFSYKDIENKEIADFLITNIKKYDMQGRVIIELLENENFKDFEELQKFVEKVKQFGVKIAIDDFGSGYSNFIYLSKLKPDFIKIDGSLVENIDKDENLYIITKHIHEFAKDLGCSTIAEFVTNKRVYEIIKKIGIDGAQGSFIEKPKELN